MHTDLVITHNQKETLLLGEKLAQEIKDNTFIGLHGPLGAGKTVFVKGVARGLGVKDEITSPTFLIVKVYRGRLDLYHIDLYRMNYPDVDMLWEYINGDGVCVVEWAEKLGELTPDRRIDVYFNIKGENEREIKIEFIGY